MFALTKHALPMMKRGSAIINTTSVTAYKVRLSLNLQHDSVSNRPAFTSYRAAAASPTMPPQRARFSRSFYTTLRLHSEC